MPNPQQPTQQNAPQPGSLSTADLAAKIRAQYPGAYDNKPDDVLVGAWLKKFPEYSQYLNPQSQPQSQNPGFQDMMRKIQEMAQSKPGQFPTAPSSNSDLSSALDSITRMNTGQPMATPQQQQDFQTGKAVGHVSGMGTVAAVSAPAAISALTAPTATTATVGTGLLDAAGNEITKDIIQYGPSLLRQGLPAVAKLAARHPGLTSGGIGYGLLKAAGIDPLDVIREMLTKK